MCNYHVHPFPVTVTLLGSQHGSCFGMDIILAEYNHLVRIIKTKSVCISLILGTRITLHVYNPSGTHNPILQPASHTHH